jgi:hypothetical protein
VLLWRPELGLEECIGQIGALRSEPQEAVPGAHRGLQEHVAIHHAQELHQDATEPVQNRVHLDEDALQDLVLSDQPIVSVIEAPDDESITAMMLELTAEGNVRTDTLRAFDHDQMQAIVQRTG